MIVSLALGSDLSLTIKQFIHYINTLLNAYHLPRTAVETQEAEKNTAGSNKPGRGGGCHNT